MQETKVDDPPGHEVEWGGRAAPENAFDRTFQCQNVLSNCPVNFRWPTAQNLDLRPYVFSTEIERAMSQLFPGTPEFLRKTLSVTLEASK